MGGVVVRGEEGIGAVHHPVVSWCVVGHGPGWVWLGVSLLLELAGSAAVWAVGVGCGYVVPSAGLVRSQGLAVSKVWLGLDLCLGFGSVRRLRR